jgi:hypothetical protein
MNREASGAKVGLASFCGGEIARDPSEEVFCVSGVHRRTAKRLYQGKKASKLLRLAYRVILSFPTYPFVRR